MADDKNWWKRKDGLMFHSEADRLHYDSLPKTTPQENRSMGLLMKIVLNVWADEHNPEDYFTDDKGGEWHVDCPTNPYGDNFQDIDGDMEAFNPISWVNDYRDAIYELDNIEYFLLHEYLYIQYPHDSKHIRTLTFVHFVHFVLHMKKLNALLLDCA